MTRTDEAILETRQLRRMRNDAKAETRMDKQWAAAEALIGELQGEAGFRYYINLRTRDGRYTGKIKESRSFGELVAYLIRNNYL